MFPRQKNTKRITCSFATVVAFELRGRFRGAGWLRDDDGIGHELLKLGIEKGWHIHWSTTGGGFYLGFASPEEWPEIERWLRAKKVSFRPISFGPTE